jgi:1-acyl-sn-glycerol-3-phosphate acyltransferase
MLRLAQVFVFYLLLCWLGLGLFIGNVLCIPLLLMSKKTRAPLVQQEISGFFRLFLWLAAKSGLMRLDLTALDKLNNESQLILLANHPSMIDVILILSRVRRAVCLMKSNIRKNVFLGIGSYMAGYVSNRHADQALRQAINSVKGGDLLLTFPEGTRTTRQPINPLKPGFALIAKRANAPMRTVLIRTNSAYLSKGWKIWRPPHFPLIYTAVLGEKMYSSGTYAETSAQVQSYFEQTLQSSIDPDLRIQK